MPPNPTEQTDEGVEVSCDYCGAHVGDYCAIDCEAHAAGTCRCPNPATATIVAPVRARVAELQRHAWPVASDDVLAVLMDILDLIEQVLRA